MAHTNHLVNYVNAILGFPRLAPRIFKVRIKKLGSTRDTPVTAEEKTYAFDDGALIKRTAKQDDYPSDAACAECCIFYEVVRQPLDKAVSPCHVSFNSACREAYWQRYFSA